MKSFSGVKTKDKTICNTTFRTQQIRYCSNTSRKLLIVFLLISFLQY